MESGCLYVRCRTAARLVTAKSMARSMSRRFDFMMVHPFGAACLSRCYGPLSMASGPSLAEHTVIEIEFHPQYKSHLATHVKPSSSLGATERRSGLKRASQAARRIFLVWSRLKYCGFSGPCFLSDGGSGELHPWGSGASEARIAACAWFFSPREKKPNDLQLQSGRPPHKGHGAWRHFPGLGSVWN